MWSNTRDSYKILHIVNNRVVNKAALEHFRKDFRNSLKRDDKLAENYSEANLEVEIHEMFDALYTADGRFVACAGIFKRPQWPEGMYRLLNRTYFSPEFRKSFEFSFYASDYLLPYQMEQLNRQLDFTFVSRQGPNGGNFLKKLQRRPFFRRDYTVSKEYIQVAPGLDDKCFQKILYYKKNPGLKLKLQCVDKLNLLPEGIREITL